MKWVKNMNRTSVGFVCSRHVLRTLSAVGTFCSMLLLCLTVGAQTPDLSTAVGGGPAIDFQRRALTISLPIVGVPFQLSYRSDAVVPKWRWSVRHAYDPGAAIFSPANGRPRPASPLFRDSAKAPQW